MKFLSEEWRAEFEKRVKEIFAEGSSPTKISVKLLECYKNVPQLDGMDFWHAYEWEDGVLVELEHGSDMATIPKDADFKSIGSYEMIVKILTGELDSSAAIITGAVQFNGNLVKAMPLMATYGTIQKLKCLDGNIEF